MAPGTKEALVTILVALTLLAFAPQGTGGGWEEDDQAFDGTGMARIGEVSSQDPLPQVESIAEEDGSDLAATFSFGLQDVNDSVTCQGAYVELRRIEGSLSTVVDSGHTDQQGTVLFSGLDNGTYLMRIETIDHQWVRVGDGTRYNDPNFHWETGPFQVDGDRNVEHHISDADRGAWALYQNVRDGASWLLERTGWQRSMVTVAWPEGDWPHSHGDAIHMPSEEEVPGVVWRRDMVLHEYGHCVHFATRGGDFPSGWGPDPHYIDSESSPGFALTEGWAQFFERAVDGEPLRSDGSSLESTTFADGPFGNGDRGDMDGFKVEGAVANLFWDMFDGVDPEDRLTGNIRGDHVDQRFDVLWDIMCHHVPEDINEIKRDWPYRDADFVAICHNARVPMELDPPSNPGAFSSSHEVGEGSLDSTVRLRWSGASDGGSGVLGYSILVNDDPYSLPDMVMDITGNVLVTGPLPPGTYYLHVRTVDQDGNWAEDAFTVGPFIILEGAVPVEDPVIPEGDPEKALAGLLIVLGVVSLALVLVVILDQGREPVPPAEPPVRSRTCPHCGAPDQGWQYCPRCGGRLR